jgi:hypothetical protein
MKLRTSIDKNGAPLQRELARMRAAHHARDGARILSDSIPFWPLEQRPIVAELVRTLEKCHTAARGTRGQGGEP